MQSAYALFVSMATQWNMAGGGFMPMWRTGLKYEVLPIVAAGIEIDWPSAAIFSDLRTLETAAMAEWARRKR
jgi:hypothetical protein